MTHKYGKLTTDSPILRHIRMGKSRHSVLSFHKKHITLDTKIAMQVLKYLIVLCFVLSEVISAPEIEIVRRSPKMGSKYIDNEFDFLEKRARTKSTARKEVSKRGEDDGTYSFAELLGMTPDSVLEYKNLTSEMDNDITDLALGPRELKSDPAIANAVPSAEEEGSTYDETKFEVLHFHKFFCEMVLT